MTNTKLDNPLAAFMFLYALPVARDVWSDERPWSGPGHSRLVADLLDLGWIEKQEGTTRFRRTDVGRDAWEAATCAAASELQYRSTWQPV